MAVKFIRRHGRVIPIHERNSVQGAALAGAGVGVAAGAGYAASHLVKSAAYAENEARGHEAMAKVAGAMARGAKAGGSKARFFTGQAIHSGNAALRSYMKSSSLFKASVGLREAGHLTGATLVGAGVYKALGDTRLKNDKKTKAAISAGAGVATHFAVRSAFARGMGVRSFSAIRSAAKAVIMSKFG